MQLSNACKLTKFMRKLQMSFFNEYKESPTSSRQGKTSCHIRDSKKLPSKT